MWTTVHPSTKLHGVICRKTVDLIFLLSQIDMCDILLNVVKHFVSHVDMINELLFSFTKKRKVRIAVAYFDRVRFSEMLWGTR
jgi:hypothetical protein